MNKIRIVFCWTGLTAYMPFCWKALMALPNVEVMAFIEKRRDSICEPYDMAAMQGIPFKIRDREDKLVPRDWIEPIKTFNADLIQVTGWFGRLQRCVAQSRELAHIPKIMTLDHQYYGTLKQRLAPWILGRYLKRFAKVGVTGERAAVYAKHLGFQDNQIEPKVIGINIKGFVNARNANGNHYPNRFLFVGRYVASKGLDVLLDAYKTYRRQVENPWPLTCCGAGPQKGLRENMEGVEDLGFKLPEKLPKIFAEHGVFVMPSLHEPWGIVIAEAAASGMPVIATSACGAVDEFVRDGVNGIIVRPGSAEELSNAFIKMHEQKEKFINSGETLSRQLTESYDFEHWAVRWRDLALGLKQARKAG